MLAPSHIWAARETSRLSGGVVITTSAAATPTVARIRSALAAASGFVMLLRPADAGVD